MTGLIITLAVLAVLLLVAALWFLGPRRRAAQAERQREEARNHLQDSQRLATQAEQSRASAEEMAARGRRERAELEERLRREEAESQQLAARGQAQEAEAARLRERAREVSPDSPDRDHDGIPDRAEGRGQLSPDGARTDHAAVRTDHAGDPVRTDHAGDPVRTDHAAADGPDARTAADRNPDGIPTDHIPAVNPDRPATTSEPRHRAPDGP